MRSPRSTSRAARSSPPIEGAGVIISSANDFRAAARRRIPRFLFDYADGGANAEETLRRNVGDLAGVALRQRVLKDVASIDLSATLFGRKLALPVVLGPVGISGMYARRGELQAARAAAAAGIPTCLSTVSICSIEEVARAADPFWFQLYVLRARAFMTALVARAKAAGAKAPIRRASCRERVCQSGSLPVVDVSFKKKNK